MWDLLNTVGSTVLAQEEFGTGGLSDWVKDNVIGLLILLGGAVALWAGAVGKISKVVTIVGGCVVALALVGIGLGNVYEDMGSWLISLFQG